MAILSRWLQLVSWICALSFSIVATAHKDDLPDIDDLSTGIAEFYQIFPRNETYAPSPLFPVVFAFQNPTIAQSLSPYIAVTLFQWNQSTSDWEVNDTAQFVPEKKMSNASDDEAFFVHFVFPGKLDTEADWGLAWELTYNNCTEGEGRQIFPYAGSFGNSIGFKTKKGGQKPDFISSSGDTQCSDFAGSTWNITKVAEPNPQSYEGQWCAYYSSVKPDPKPCEVQVASKIQESILASATNAFCHWRDVACPGYEDDEDEEDHSGTIRVSLAATVAACFVSFAVGLGLFIA